MRKSLLGLLIVGLLCWTGQVSATTINLNNSIVQYTIEDGVVTSAGFVGDVNLLESFSFFVFADQINPAQQLNSPTAYALGTKWVDSIGTYSNKYQFSKAIANAEIGVEYMLLPGKTYLDVRYYVYANANDVLTNVRAYINLESSSGLLGKSSETAPGSNWQMVNDLQPAWGGGAANWPIPNVVLSGGRVGFAARVVDDDYVGNTKAIVDDLISRGTGKVALDPFTPSLTQDNRWNTIVQPPTGVQAIAMRVPTSPGVVSVAPIFYVESRLEVQAVPEPCTISLVLAGLAGFGVMRRRSRKS
ncbi:MAG: PEP-CTERM sorting domain-containing protein [Candidatus Desantisbacteria bacterium]